MKRLKDRLSPAQLRRRAARILRRQDRQMADALTLSPCCHARFKRAPILRIGRAWECSACGEAYTIAQLENFAGGRIDFPARVAHTRALLGFDDVQSTSTRGTSR